MVLEFVTEASEQIEAVKRWGHKSGYSTDGEGNRVCIPKS